MLLVSLIAVVAVFDDFPTESLRPGPRGRLWQCHECRRVERTPLRNPRCYGSAEYPHARSTTQPIAESAGLRPSDPRRLFK